MDNDKRRFESVFSTKVRAGKRRTYFFDVRKTKGDDYYLTLTESTKKFNSDGYERHKIFLYKEDFNRFMSGLEETVNYIKTELMPDYDYDEYTRRHEEWEARREAEENGEVVSPSPTTNEAPASVEASDDATTSDEETAPEEPTSIDSEEDMSW